MPLWRTPLLWPDWCMAEWERGGREGGSRKEGWKEV